MKYKVGDELITTTENMKGRYILTITHVGDTGGYTLSIYDRKRNEKWSEHQTWNESWLDKNCRKLTKLDKALK